MLPAVPRRVWDHYPGGATHIDYLMSAITDNIALLNQMVSVLEDLPAETYAKKLPEAMNASVGAHLRHVLDHYLLFLSQNRTGEINYDKRGRDVRVESDPAYARTIIRDIISGLEVCAAVEDVNDWLRQPLTVRMETSAQADNSANWCASSIERELQFLISHTVHHYALIVFMSRQLNLTLPDQFGYAPSTLKYLTRDSASAHGGRTGC